MVINGGVYLPHTFYPKLTTASQIATYLTAQQKKQYGAVFDQSYQVLVRNIKLLLKEHPANDILYCINRSLHLSEYPFSTKFIKEQLEWLQVQRSLSMSQYVRIEPNKS